MFFLLSPSTTTCCFIIQAPLPLILNNELTTNLHIVSSGTAMLPSQGEKIQYHDLKYYSRRWAQIAN